MPNRNCLTRLNKYWNFHTLLYYTDFNKKHKQELHCLLNMTGRVKKSKNINLNSVIFKKKCSGNPPINLDTYEIADTGAT